MSHDSRALTLATLRIVVVMYRSRLRTLRPLFEAVRAAGIEAPVIVSVVINRDALRWQRSCPRRIVVGPGMTMEVCFQNNAGGVTAAYNLTIERGDPSDVMIILDADSRLPSAYFTQVWAQRKALGSGLVFLGIELFSGELRVSPYRLDGAVPRAIDGELSHEQPLPFAGGVGVINSGLAGSVSAFRNVNGFSPRISLDLSDVAWSIEAARKGAALLLLPLTHSHHLSIRTTGLGLRRLRKYLAACWWLGIRTRDVYGSIRLALRGLRALRWPRRPA